MASKHEDVKGWSLGEMPVSLRMTKIANGGDWAVELVIDGRLVSSLGLFPDKERATAFVHAFGRHLQGEVKNATPIRVQQPTTCP